MSHRLAIEEASKCLLCHDAPCATCPGGKDPAGFIRSIRFGNAKAAAKSMGGAAGGRWSCPFGRACEKLCIRSRIDRAVEIGALHKYLLSEGAKARKLTGKRDLSVDFLGVRCENPFFLASSPISGSYDLVSRAFEAGWGGAFYKTAGLFTANECSPRFSKTGNEGTPWSGFKNMEQISDKPAEVNFDEMRRLKRDYPGKVLAASIMGGSEEEWRTLARMCEEAGVDLIEGNFSCPQMVCGTMGSDTGTNPELVGLYTKAVTETTKIPFIAKMTPNITDITVPAAAAAENGALGIAAINTVKCISGIDFENMTGLPVVDGKSSVSGYSGAAIKPAALRFAAELRQNSKLKHIALSGAGGIETWRDAAEFLSLGCGNVQVCTAVMQYGYRIVEDMASGLAVFMDERGFTRLDEFIGSVLPNIVSPDELDRGHYILPNFNHEKCVGCGRCYISCRDAARQAIAWDGTARKPLPVKANCIGCHLCICVCPSEGCITPGEVRPKAR